MNKRKCDKCDEPATFHSVEVLKGKKIDKHLCDKHAAEEGLTVKAVHTPINELLTNFVKLHSGASVEQELACESCGLTFAQFREHGVLGCPTCYTAFEAPLTPMLETAHEGGTHHLGKFPHRAGAGEEHQLHLLRIRKRLQEAVTSEDYELAATLRDQLRQLEEPKA